MCEINKTHYQVCGNNLKFANFAVLKRLILTILKVNPVKVSDFQQSKFDEGKQL